MSRPTVAAIFMLAGLLVAMAPGSTARGDDYALVVGVNACPAFRLPDGSAPRPLRGAEHDADAMADVLRTQFRFPDRHITLLKGQEATHDKLASNFAQLAKRMGPEDGFVFYFSGHGTQVDDRRPFDEPDRLDEALCMADATAEGAGLVLDDELGLWLDDLRVRRVTVLLDCCHAGTGTKEPDDDLLPRYLPIVRPGGVPTAAKPPWPEILGTLKSPGSQITAVFACGADQQAYERRLLDVTPSRAGGQFTHYLLQGLQDARADSDGNGSVSAREALDYATCRLDETFNRARAEQSDQQKPLLETGDPEASLFSRAAGR